MPITSVQQLRDAIRRAKIPAKVRRLALDYLQQEPDRELDDNAVRAFFWFGPLQLRAHIDAILAAGDHTVTRDRVLRLRVSSAEQAEIQRLAADAGMTISEYLRQSALETN